ncbi:M1 family aminopeptidase [Chitinophaga sp. RAB17]|uniref:ABC transporter permease/M1 family aminopeptidase n=1 Tax=Chitinophaga sp. RAB17 TaxID=3233049 RepID=UPI003F919C68
MKAIFLFDITGYTKGLTGYLVAASLLGIGIFAGAEFHLNIGDGVYLNSPYTIGFMLGMLSLSVIFLATVFAQQLLFKEWDTNFDLILFATPVGKGNFAGGRFLSLLTLTLISFLLLTTGFAIGQQTRTDSAMLPGMHLLHYVYPFILFGGFNSLFVCSFLFFIAWGTRSKLLTAVGGLLLYVLYMVILLFSNSPFMAQAAPQSLAAQQISAITDPFGLSAYFYASRNFSVSQRNTVLTPLSGYLLVNRLITLAISGICFLLGYISFSYTRKRQIKKETTFSAAASPFHPDLSITTTYNIRAQLQSIWSFIKMDLNHTLKNIPFTATAVILLFHIAMEMYAAIEKGIRLPQQYASSGLMATTISKNFHLIGVLLMVYFVNDMFWKSRAVKFSPIENTTAHHSFKQWAHWCSSAMLLCCYTILVIMLGLIFQVTYQYPRIDWPAYAGVVIFCTCPLLLLTGCLLLINQLIRGKYIALGVCLLTALTIASPLSKKFIATPLLRFFSGFNGTYSDFNGYGAYLPSFVERLVFGAGVIGILWMIYDVVKNKRLKIAALVSMLALATISLFSGKAFMREYLPGDRTAEMEAAARYEKKYRKYASMPQPTITAVNTSIDLYPGKRAYTITGKYIIKNLTTQSVPKILINFDDGFNITNTSYASQNEVIPINDAVSELALTRPLQPNDSACIRFEMSYHWVAVNGHQPFNAIIENGSFMRISRYYPQIGYQSQNEVADSLQRKQLALGAPTPVKPVDAPKSSTPDFIDLDMVISTEHQQRAIGTGELIKQWQQGDRNYFHYRTNAPIPFRFAVSSAHYSMRHTTHRGIEINVCYQPKHDENVDHLISCAKRTLDYCQENFGPYPFRAITFAEISSFTSGFAATAYPANIFMAENMLFHANIKADQQQDVINELAGHELSHLWWGNNQIDPDNREGAAMLTETLAMYTEMMLYKKMYGREKMMEKVKVHQQIYDMEKGFSKNQPLYKVLDQQTHISYSKGAIIMVKLSEMIGENKVNEALKNFLQRNKYPQPKPVSTDLITELLKVSEEKYHREIKSMFMDII